MNPIELLRYASPVAFAAMGETVGQRAGVLNIGLEGAMLTSAYFGMVVCDTTKSPWLGVLAAVVAALVVMAISGWFMVYLAADQVVVGTAVNLMALGVTSTLFRARYSDSGQLLSVPTIPRIGEFDPLLLLLLLAIPVVWFALMRTGWGLALRAAGEYPKSAEAAGYSVNRLRFGACLVGGAFAGLAGAYLSLGIAGSFAENMTAGRGFVAIAMVTFGRWRPFWVFAAALLVGFAESLQFKVQSLGWNVPFQLLIALPYLIALAVLVIVGKGTVAPGALGVAYRREK